MAVRVVTAARSEAGPVRPSNQDSGYAGARLAVVADGIGGHAAGDVASCLVTSELVGLDAGADAPADADGAPAREHLARAVDRAQEALLRRVEADPSTRGMGTTLTALLHAGDHLVLAHVGDSRCYRRHRGALQQVTRDDTFVQQLVDEGHITAEQAEVHPMRHAITASLGDGGTPAQVHLSVHDAVAGDRWLLCSDGLSGALDEDEIATVTGQEAAPGACAGRLVELALAAGATDNVTCVVVDVVEAGACGDGSPAAVRPQAVGAAARGSC
jgi:PPM family protein phosphatase